jgi:hypothetical protein
MNDHHASPPCVDGVTLAKRGHRTQPTKVAFADSASMADPELVGDAKTAYGMDRHQPAYQNALGFECAECLFAKEVSSAVDVSSVVYFEHG